MNWEFHAVNSTDSKELMLEYRTLAILGIEGWLATHKEPTETQEGAGISEFPRGFYHDGPSYSFRIRVWGPGGCMSPAEYDVAVTRTFHPRPYDKTKDRMRIRIIDCVPPIE
jgi:hypothetical protein